MGVTIEQVQALLRKPNATFYSDGENTLVYPFPHQGQMITVFVQLLEDGEYLRFFIPFYLCLVDSSDRDGVLLKLLDLNRQYKFLKFGVDPEDMEVTASIEIPIEDGTLTENQVTRCMAAITSIAMDERTQLKTLLTSGIYPSCDDPKFQKALENLLGEEDAAQSEGMDSLPSVAEASAEAVLEMDEEALNRLLEEIDSDESWEA